VSAHISVQAEALVRHYGFHLVEMPPGTKAPRRVDWQKSTIHEASDAQKHWEAHPDDNMGVVLGPSRLCSLDADDLPATRDLLAEFGVDIDVLASTNPTIQGNPTRFRILFRVPEGIELARHSLNWPSRDDPAKRHVIFELRAGDVQDVLPPSLHPDGMRYQWLVKPSGAIGELPASLLTIWQNWDVFKQNAAALCPWNKPPEPTRAPPRAAPVEGSVIEAWNAAHDLCATLAAYGYTRVGKRYLSPHSSTKLPGVVLLEGAQRCYVHHASDPLCSDESGQPVNAFDLFAWYEHGGDVKRAVRAAADALGLKPQPRRPTLAVVNGAAVPNQALESDPIPEVAIPPQFSEDSLALQFTARHGHELRFVAAWGRWLRWNGQRWSDDDTLVAFDLARLVCRDAAIEAKANPDCPKGLPSRLTAARTRAAVETLCRSDRKHAAVIAQWDANPWHLNTPAGIVDLTTGAIRPSLQEDYCSKITEVAPGGECPLWLQFLADVTAGDTALQSYLARVIGYSLTAVTSEHALFFFYGTGRNGKGTFLNTIARILGDYAKVASMETFTESKTDRHPQELAGLMGRRLVTAQETEEGKRWAESRLKALTGGDPITARFMRQDEFTFMPQFKLLFAGNHKPALRNVDEAIRARMNLIPFTVAIPREKRDKRLSEKLWNEASGILKWAIDGCLEWQRIGLDPPAAVVNATDDYLEAQDVIMLFVEECCEVSIFHAQKLQALFERYKAWCKEAGTFELGRQKFQDALEARGFRNERKGNNVLIIGLRLPIADERRNPQ